VGFIFFLESAILEFIRFSARRMFLSLFEEIITLLLFLLLFFGGKVNTHPDSFCILSCTVLFFPIKKPWNIGGILISNVNTLDSESFLTLESFFNSSTLYSSSSSPNSFDEELESSES
jgi:hypothetical protein